MSSKKPKPCLVVLDVGHGSAAVLHDEGGTLVVDAGPKGAHVQRHLRAHRVRRVETMLLSHADADHIGGAITLLLDASVRIGEVLLNSDSAKKSAAFQQFCVALVEANRRAKTQITGRLTTSARLKRKGAQVEVLHPPDAWALAGAGGRTPTGERLTSNSLSAAVRISRDAKCSVLLGADIEFSCLDQWKAGSVKPCASVLVFPHHGGLPGTSDRSDAALFGFEITRMVSPEVVIFSNHRSKFGNPQDEVVAAISKAVRGIRFACTQLPDRLHQHAETNALWSLHKPTGHKGVIEGSICLEFQKCGIRICFGEAP